MQVILIVLNKHPEHKQNAKISMWVDKTGPGVAESEREKRRHREWEKENRSQLRQVTESSGTLIHLNRLFH